LKVGCSGLSQAAMVSWIHGFSNTYHRSTARYPGTLDLLDLFGFGGLTLDDSDIHHNQLVEDLHRQLGCLWQRQPALDRCLALGLLARVASCGLEVSVLSNLSLVQALN